MGKFEKIILTVIGIGALYGMLTLLRERNELQRQIYELKLLQKCQESYGLNKK